MDVVQRPFQAEGLIRRQGEVVDASTWRHGARLREQRYLAGFSGEPVKCACGRLFANEASREYHASLDHKKEKTRRQAQEEMQKEETERAAS